jgi:Zn-dependent protease
MDDWMQKLPIFLMFIPSLTFHEAAHAWVAHRLGDDTAKEQGRLTLNPLAHIDWIGTILVPGLMMFAMNGVGFIGWAKPVPVDLRNLTNERRDDILISLAGPASNLVLALLSLLVVRWSGIEAKAVRDALVIFAMVNVGLAIFNLIPIPPLDGWHCVKQGFRLPEEWAQRGGMLWLFLLLFLINYEPFMIFLNLWRYTIFSGLTYLSGFSI